VKIRDAIMDSLPEARMVPIAEVYEALAEYDRNAVDCALRGMARDKSLVTNLGYVGRPGASMVGRPAYAHLQPPQEARPAPLAALAAITDEDSKTCLTCGERKAADLMVKRHNRPIAQCLQCRSNAAKSNGRKSSMSQSAITSLAQVGSTRPKVSPPADAGMRSIREQMLADLRDRQAKIAAAIAALEALS
jgi:hypothetical protein